MSFNASTSELQWLALHLEGLLVILRNYSDLSTAIEAIIKIYPDAPSASRLHGLLGIRLLEIPTYLNKSYFQPIYDDNE